MSKKDITLNARFTMLSSMRRHASQQQSEGRDSVLAKKRGLKSPVVASHAQVAFHSLHTDQVVVLLMHCHDGFAEELKLPSHVLRLMCLACIGTSDRQVLKRLRL